MAAIVTLFTAIHAPAGAQQVPVTVTVPAGSTPLLPVTGAMLLPLVAGGALLMVVGLLLLSTVRRLERSMHRGK